MAITLPDRPGGQQVKECACPRSMTTTPPENAPHPADPTDRAVFLSRTPSRHRKPPPNDAQSTLNRPPPCCDIGNPMLDAPRRIGRPLFVHARASRGPT